MVVGLSFFLYQYDNNNEVLENQTGKMKDELVAVTTSDFSIVAENRQEREEADKLVYGLSSWAFNLVEKRISIATLANLYTIIGL